MTTLEDVLVVLGATYAAFVVMVLYAVRRPAPRRGAVGPVAGAGWRGLVRHVLVTAAGGYAALLSIVAVFHVVVVGQRGALRSALWGGAFLVACAIPSFLLLSWAERRVRR